MEQYWTKQRVDLLKRLYSSGIPTSRIAVRLGGGVSRNAVIGKVNRLRLKAEGTPAKVGKHPIQRKAKSPPPKPARSKQSTSKKAGRKSGGSAKPKAAAVPKKKPTPKRTEATTKRVRPAASKPARAGKGTASGAQSAGRMSKFSRRRPSKVSARASLRKPGVKSVDARQAPGERRATVTKKTAERQPVTKQSPAKGTARRPRSKLRVAPGKRPRTPDTPKKSAARLSGAARKARNRARARGTTSTPSKLKVRAARTPAGGTTSRPTATTKTKSASGRTPTRPKRLAPTNRKQSARATRNQPPASAARTRRGRPLKQDVRGRSKGTERTRTARRVRVRAAKAEAPNKASVTNSAPPTVETPRVDLPPRMIQMAELTEHVCRWPVGDPRESGFGFCGNPVAPRKVYCQLHADQAYQPLTPRRERTRGR